jgi:hypothetical protein
MELNPLAPNQNVARQYKEFSLSGYVKDNNPHIEIALAEIRQDETCSQWTCLSMLLFTHGIGLSTI